MSLRPVVWILVGMAADFALAVLVGKLLAGKTPGLNRYRPTPPPSEGECCACR